MPCPPKGVPLLFDLALKNGASYLDIFSIA